MTALTSFRLAQADPAWWPHADRAVAVRFAAKVLVLEPSAGRGCMIWVGGVESDSGYGRFHIDGGRHGQVIAAHRWSYTASSGVDLAGVPVVRHSCDERFCPNFEHLLAGTHAQNVADQVARGRASGAIGFSRRPVERSLAIRAAALAGEAAAVAAILDAPGIQLELQLPPTPQL